MDKLLYIILILTIFLAVSLIITNILVFKIKNKKDNSNQDGNVEKLFSEIQKLTNFVSAYNQTVTEIIKSYSESTIKSLNSIGDNQFERLDNLNKRLQELTTTLEMRLEKNNNVLELSLTNLKQANEQKLEQMRQTVDEKLNESLEKRLNESFNLISERLENVSAGLGEMRSLAGSVGDLKKVLTNVKTRGTFGEVQLGNLLEQMLAPNQYMANVTIKSVENDLSREFKEALREVKFGKSLTESLKAMSDRIPSESINNIILTLTQADVFGTSIITTLYTQVNYLRDKRNMEIKAQISKMPIKISIISVLFFIPLVLLIILGPIILNYIS